MEPTTFTWRSKKGKQIFAQCWAPDGQGAAGVVAFVHGLGEHTGRYDHVARAFTAAGMAFLAFDLPGHGRSEGKRGVTSFEEVADEIDHLLSDAGQRYPGKPLSLYGHSLGGVLVLHYLVTRRPKLQAAISTSPGLAAGTPVPVFKVLLARFLHRLMPSFTLSSGMNANNISRDALVVSAYRSDPQVHDRVSTLLGWDILTGGKKIIARAANLQVPLLLTAGTGDHIVSMRAIQAFVEHAPRDLVTLKLFEGGFHEPHNDLDKEEALRCLVDYILRQWPDENGILASALDSSS